MTYRKLRIAWSVGWGVAAVLVCVLWGRSYRERDELRGRVGIDRGFVLYSMWGRVEWDDFYLPRAQIYPLGFVTYSGDEVPKFIFPRKRSGVWRVFDFHCENHPQCFIVAAPHWYLVFASAVMGSVPWIGCKWQFSLRTLLIATTLVAALLGLIVYAVRV
jgi:hypothetical protein